MIFISTNYKYALFDVENQRVIYSKSYITNKYGDYIMPVVDAAGYVHSSRGCAIEKIYIPTGEAVDIYLAKYNEGCSSKFIRPNLDSR